VGFARRVFTAAWIWGAVSLLPLYFLERGIGAASPPAITHPEYFYGFIGCALAWQVVFFLISRRPRALRALMPVAVLEKLGYAVPAFVLVALGRVPSANIVFGTIDLVLGALFWMAFMRTPAG
jgi:hypothetical protein